VTKDINKIGKHADVVSIGETMIYLQAENYGLLRYAQRFDKFIGGTESNTMISLAKLGFSTSWISRLGTDEFGYNIRDFIRGHGVDVSRVIFDEEAPTGVFFVEKNANDETRSFYYRTGSAASKMCPSDLDLGYICAHQILHLTGITPILSASCHDMTTELISKARQQGLKISLDPNLRLRMADIETFRQIIHPILSKVDIFLPSDQELLLLMGTKNLEDAICRAADLGLNHLVIKRADQGSMLIKEGIRYQEPVFPVKKVVSSMAAGDAFNAGYLAAELKGFDGSQTLKLANCLGAMATLAWGPYESIPDWETILRYLEGKGVIER
jgi:2-dehydro-3-deoxygluconokinase